MNIIQKAIFEEADKKQITLNYNFKVLSKFYKYKIFKYENKKLK